MKSLSLRVRYSLSISWREGIPAHIMLGIIDYFVVPYALFLGASVTQVGLIASVPHLFSALTQFYAKKVLKLSTSRVHFLTGSAWWQGIAMLGVALIVFLPQSLKFPALLVGIIAFRILSGFTSNVWGSLLSDYLPPHIRGQFMGWRSQVVGLAGLIGVAVSGIFLFSMKKISGPFAFFCLFLLAAFCRFLSSRLMAKLYNIKQHQAPGSDFTFYNFIKQFRSSNYVKFVLFSAGVMAAAHIAAPYFSVYLLEELKFSYLQYMLIHFAGIAAGLISYPIWGKHGDITGQARLLKGVSILIAFVPLCWLVSTNIIYLMAVEFYAGFIWGAFNLCALAFIFDAVTPPKRVQCLGYFNLINGVGIFVGAMLGSLLLKIIPPLWGSHFYTLFLISGLARLTIAMTLSKRFKEVRSIAAVTNGELFSSVIGIRPLIGLTRGWNFFPEYQKKPEID